MIKACQNMKVDEGVVLLLQDQLDIVKELIFFKPR